MGFFRRLTPNGQFYGDGFRSGRTPDVLYTLTSDQKKQIIKLRHGDPPNFDVLPLHSNVKISKIIGSN